MSPDNNRLGEVMALEAALKRIEIHQLVKLLIERGILERADAVGFFVNLSVVVNELTVSPLMKGAAATASRHYEDLASMIEVGDELHQTGH